MLAPPPGSDWADPCVVYHEGRHYLFIEVKVYAQRRGHLAVIMIDEQDLFNQKLKAFLDAESPAG